jgi:hypothetical protein
LIFIGFVELYFRSAIKAIHNVNELLFLETLEVVVELEVEERVAEDVFVDFGGEELAVCHGASEGVFGVALALDLEKSDVEAAGAQTGGAVH